MNDDAIFWYINDDAIFWYITIICLLISVPAAFTMNESLHKEHPDVKPYAWGYYIGLMGSLSGTAVAILQFIAASKTYGNRSDTFILLGIFFLVTAVVHIFIVKRNKWAWIVGIILQLNPILWIINGIYLKNRWAEMGGLPIGTMTNKFSKASFANRTLLAGSAFWTLVVLAFVFMFEPYGRYVSDSEWWQVIKIIVFPPVVSVAGYFLYVKVIKQEQRNTNEEQV
jgi:hypothetical protein